MHSSKKGISINERRGASGEVEARTRGLLRATQRDRPRSSAAKRPAAHQPAPAPEGPSRCPAAG